MTGTDRDRHIACGGNLVAAHRPSRYASIDARVPLDRTTSVQALPTGSLETVGPAAVSGWSTLGMGGITALTAGALAAFPERLKPPARRTGFRVLLVPGSLTSAGLVVYVAVRAVA